MAMLSLKLKLNPTDEQTNQLDKMFWKWASICSRMSIKKADKEKLSPRANSEGIWFSKTQLNQARTDVNDLVSALKKSAEQKKRTLQKQENSTKEIRDAIGNIANRDQNPDKPSNFRIKKWVEKTNNLNQKYHTLKYWQARLEQSEKRLQKQKQTVETIERGRVHFKPKKITIHQNEFSLNFANSKIMLTPFNKSGTGLKQLEVRIITAPIQKSSGSSAKSALYMKTGINSFLVFAINQSLFGFNRAGAALLKAKKPEKLIKKDQYLAKKQQALLKDTKKIEKMLNRKLTANELEIFKAEQIKLFQNITTYIRSPEYINTLNNIAAELLTLDHYFKPNKYVVLVRKPINRYKTKKIKNLQAGEWEYFLQLSYEPFQPPTIDTKNIMGIDRGVKHLLAVAIFNPNEKIFTLNRLIANPVLGWKYRGRKLRRALRALERRIRVTTGEHIHENQLKLQLKSIENRVDNLYHNISAEIVRCAKENKAVIVFESLERTGLKQHGRSKGRHMKALNYFLSNFDYGKIAALVKYKADKEGVPVFDILPAYTSQNCAKCLIETGDINAGESNYCRSKENSKIGICQKHGEIDADLNAARTIAVCYDKRLNDPMPFGSRK
jgi:IS605 OrfB family transposase